MKVQNCNQNKQTEAVTVIGWEHAAEVVPKLFYFSSVKTTFCSAKKAGGWVASTHGLQAINTAIKTLCIILQYILLMLISNTATMFKFWFLQYHILNWPATL